MYEVKLSDGRTEKVKTLKIDLATCSPQEASVFYHGVFATQVGQPVAFMRQERDWIQIDDSRVLTERNAAWKKVRELEAEVEKLKLANILLEDK